MGETAKNTKVGTVSINNRDEIIVPQMQNDSPPVDTADTARTYVIANACSLSKNVENILFDILLHFFSL